MTIVHEVSDGPGISHIGSEDDGKGDDLINGYELGHEAARRGDLICMTIYRMSHTFRDGYLLGYECYKAEAVRFHRRNCGDDND